jgi:hypothetical protein
MILKPLPSLYCRELRSQFDRISPPLAILYPLTFAGNLMYDSSNKRLLKPSVGAIHELPLPMALAFSDISIANYSVSLYFDRLR